MIICLSRKEERKMMNCKVRFCSIVALVGLSLLVSGAFLQGASQAKAKKINLNTATQAELEGLKGIGPALAQKIIAARPFKSVDDLKNVSGISQATFEAIKDQVTVRSAKAAAQTAETKAATTSEKAVQTTEVKTKAKVKATSEKAAQETGQIAGGELVNINTADKAALENLPGVGAATADRIIAARPFKSVDDLKNVKGIGEAKFDALKGLVTVETLSTARTARTRATSTTQSASKTVTQTTSAGPIDLNSADKAALEGLPGVGPALAEKIIAARPFKSVDDLNNVSGIGPAKFDALKGLVTVGEGEESVQPKLKPGQTININTATQEQLESLLGIGPVKAQAIIAGRPYASIEDIMKVKGIKEKTFVKIKDYIVVK
jgi:competence protein ComEA